MKVFDSSKKIIVSALLLICSAFSLAPAKTAVAEDTGGLVKALHGHDTQTQMSAVDALERLKEPWAVDALLDFVFIEIEDWRVKIRAIHVLGEIRDPRVSDRLVTLFNDPFLNEECPAMKWHTALALGKDFNKGSRAVESLIDALDYNNLLVREGVIQSLGKIKDSRAVPFLIPALKSKSFAIRISAIKALENIGDPQAVPQLRQTADHDGDAQIKEAALSALRSFGED
jgi:HEAT repeat protein